MSRRDDESVKRMARLVGLMEDWANWVQAGHAPQGEQRSSVFACAAIDWAEGVDLHRNQAINAAVYDLPPSQSAAVQKRYGVCRVWRFPRDNYEAMLLAGHEALLVSLPRRNVVI